MRAKITSKVANSFPCSTQMRKRRTTGWFFFNFYKFLDRPIDRSQISSKASRCELKGFKY